MSKPHVRSHLRCQHHNQTLSTVCCFCV